MFLKHSRTDQRGGGTFSPAKNGTRSRRCWCFSSIQGQTKEEGVISVPLKMEHVRERVRVSQVFKDTPKRRGVISVPLKMEPVRERVRVSQVFKDRPKRRG